MAIKKILKLNIVFLAALYMMACAEGRGVNVNSVKGLMESRMNGESEMTETSESVEETQFTVKNPYDKIDVDLTEMPQKLAYSTASRMNLVSEQYLGQIVKMRGICSIYYDEKKDIHYLTCEINDETACCIMGIEFELMDEYKFPDDFPKEKEEVTVVGIFDTYKEGARTYKTLRKAVLL